MNREYVQWYSPRLSREMELLVFGHAGAAVLVFPTSMGRFYQYEDFRMVEALRHHIEQGWIQLFCVDGVDSESWYNTGMAPHDRAVRHGQYEDYLVREVLPFIQSRNHSGFLTVTGNSFGAYHAVNFSLKHPWLVNRVIAISGSYGVPYVGGGYSDQEIYFNSPLDYLPNLNDDAYLRPLRETVQLYLMVGGWSDMCHEGTLRMASVLTNKGIPHRLDVWDDAWHDWPWWRQMILTHI
ncbi:MAG TPA: alpha/beta hydrolase-fold protein [Chloroflexota bacterium]|nr:alpha/beta hydrolase-fold protein [Chloroflexota bacterium]